MSNKNINEANTNAIGKWSSFLMQCYTELHDAVQQDKKNQGVFCTEPQDLSCSQNKIIHLLSIEMKKICMVNKNKKIKSSNVTLLRCTWFHQVQVVYKALYAEAVPTYIDYEQSLFFLGRAKCKWPRAWLKAWDGKGTKQERLPAKPERMVCHCLVIFWHENWSVDRPGTWNMTLGFAWTTEVYLHFFFQKAQLMQCIKLELILN